MTTEELDFLFEARKQELFFYSPYSFLRKIPGEEIFQKSVKRPLKDKINLKAIPLFNIEINNKNFLFLVEYLKWDSNYFGFPNFKFHTVLYDEKNLESLDEALIQFKLYFFDGQKKKYLFIEIPSEDIKLIQALGNAGFRLIETRMTYYLNLFDYDYQRFKVRSATVNEIHNLKRVARDMRNPFDRFHADPVFEQDKADEFLATFIEESIKGFADYTMVPDEVGTPPDAFLTAKYLKNEWRDLGVNVSKMVLSSVSSETCKGWYKKLISEMAFHLKEMGAEYAFMHPASTNKAVISTYETLGCKLGQVSHVFSIS